MAWICKITHVFCPPVSMRFEVSLLFSRGTIDLQIKLFLCSLSLFSLHLLHVCLRAQTHCSLLLLPRLYLLSSLYRCWSFIIFQFSSDAEILSHHLHLIPTFVFNLCCGWVIIAKQETRNNLNWTDQKMSSSYFLWPGDAIRVCIND